jgi:tetratricopeptide (TPR) repeat protein
MPREIPSPQDPQSRHWPSELVAALLLVAAVWMVYGPALDAPFVHDDTNSIVENESIRHLLPLWGDAEHAGSLTPPKGLPTSARPLVNLSFAINYRFGGLEPRGYRAVNILLHALNALLIAALLRRAMRLPYFRGMFDDSAGLVAWAVALVWALHPLVTETVAYVTQRTELMVTLCYLVTFYASLRFWEGGAFRWLLLAVLACWAGMASKEVMASAPLMVLLFDRTFYARSLREAWQKSRPLYVGLFASWLLLLCLAGTGPHSASAGFHLGVSATDWWLTQSQVLWMYLKLAIWPWPLAIHYEPPYLTSLAEAWVYAAPLAVVATITLLLLWRRSAVGYLGTFVFAILAPTFVVPIITEIAAERRMYLPLAALVTLVVVGAYDLLRRAVAAKTALKVVTVTAIFLAVAGGIMSSRRLKTYSDELALWQDVLVHQPLDATAEYNAGTILLERQEPQQAAEHFRRAIALRDDYPPAHHNLGAALSTLGQSAEATREFERAVELEPRYALGRVKLGITAMNAGRTAEAKAEFQAALRSQPNDAAAHVGLAGIYLKAGELEDAIRHARAAVAAAPNNAEAHNTLGAALAQLQQFDEAVEQFETAVRLDPKMLQALGNLMAAYGSVGRSHDAIATAEKARALARASGDTAFEEQIDVFLFDYRMQTANPPAPAPAETNQE